MLDAAPTQVSLALSGSKVATLDPNVADVSVVATATVPAVSIYNAAASTVVARTLPNPNPDGAALGTELRKLERPCEIHITHLKPGQMELTMAEIERCLGEFKPQMLRNNQVFEF